MTTQKEIAGNLAVILFGAVFLVYTVRYPLDTWENPGPAVFPLIIGSVLTLLGLWQLGLAVVKSRRRDHDRRRGDQSGIKSLLENRGEGKALRMIGLFVLYLLAMQWIGFFVSTFAFGTIASRLTETRGWGRPIALSAGLTFFCYLLFEVWLKLSFPRGVLF
jgi:putative tricarboxylic transport membrane protein